MSKDISPCKGVCQYSVELDKCIGCLRTLEEICSAGLKSGISPTPVDEFFKELKEIASDGKRTDQSSTFRSLSPIPDPDPLRPSDVVDG